jgi:hypothetical protein
MITETKKDVELNSHVITMTVKEIKELAESVGWRVGDNCIAGDEEDVNTRVTILEKEEYCEKENHKIMAWYTEIPSEGCIWNN